MSKSVHAFGDDALANHDATALAELIKSGELKVEEVVAAAIERAQKVDPHIRGIETPGFERALAQAGKHPRGFFAGVPTFVKDNTPVIGYPTNHGSRAINSSPATEHGPFARQYLDQGFICLGKSVLPEFGFNATTEHADKEPTRNPWHTDYSSGASSGGSAVLVAAGVVPIAHANDGGGSIRIPAACCGLVGLKPSRGRMVDAELTRALPINIVGEGVVTRSVRDTAHFFTEAEKYYRNPRLPAVGSVAGPGKQRLKVGLVVDSVTGHPTDMDTRNTVEATAALLQAMGHQVEVMPLPVEAGFADDFAMYWGMLSFLTGKFGRHSVDPSFKAEDMDDLSKGLSKMFRKRFYKIPGAMYRLRKSYHDYAEALGHYDAVLTPVLGHTTPKIGHLSPNVPFEELFERLTRYVSFTPLANATGAPAIALPMGRTDEGLPVAVQLSANHGHERLLLELAFELEQAQPWATLASH